MHDTDTAPGVPGRSGSSTVYAGQLEAIVLRLLAYVAEFPATKLLYISTTSYNCDAVIDASIQTLQPRKLLAHARIMEFRTWTSLCSATRMSAGAPLRPLAAKASHRGAARASAPTAPGYSWLVNSTILPAVQHALGL